jgi:hypothetical protein
VVTDRPGGWVGEDADPRLARQQLELLVQAHPDAAGVRQRLIRSKAAAQCLDAALTMQRLAEAAAASSISDSD